MSTEKLSLEQAMQRLSETSINHNNRVLALETTLQEIRNELVKNHPTTDNFPLDLSALETHMSKRIETIQTQSLDWQTNTMATLDEGKKQWNYLTDVVRDMKNDLKLISKAIASNISSNQTNSPNDEQIPTSYEYQGTSTPTNTTQHIAQTNHNEYQDHQTEVQQLASSHVANVTTTSPLVHTVVIPPTASIPVFYGKSSESPRQFLIRVKEYTQTVNNWDDLHLLHGISQFLRDNALEWYCQLRLTHRQPKSWMEFNTQFLAQFNSPIRRAKLEQEWRECHQGPNETINEFIVRLRTLWSEQKPHENEHDLIRHLRCKMRNDLLTIIGVSKGDSLDEIIIEAQRIEEILYQRSKNSSSSTRNNTYQNQVTYPHQDRSQRYQQQTNTYTPYQSRDSSNRTSNVRNYRETQKELRCFTCGQSGHTSWQCYHGYDRATQANTWDNSKNE